MNNDGLFAKKEEKILPFEKKKPRAFSHETRAEIISLEEEQSKKDFQELAERGMYLDEEGHFRMIKEAALREQILESKEKLTQIVGSEDVF